ncbi:hypothetical protein C8R43DRAFT_659388 [Mycena crocata]|nr:hypothetical protein C8R43DRAFT_659388 [Mycena crocata]
MKKGNKLDSADWISNLKLLVVTLKSSAACTPVPCLQSIFEAVSAVLDLVERVGKNDTDLKYLSESVIKITELLADELNSHSDSLDVRLVELCNDFGRYLNLVGSAVDKTLLRKSKFWLRKYLKAKSIRDSLDDFTRRLSDLRADLTLSAALGARFQIVDTDRRVQEIQRSLAHSSPEISAPKTFELSGIEEDILVFKPSELYLNFNTVYVSKVTLSGAEEQHRGVIRTYGARVGPAITTVRVYEGLHARQMWKRDLYMFAEHLRVPGVAQIYGMCTSPRLQALVFHDELVPIDIYAAAIKSAIQYVDFELSLFVSLLRRIRYFN